MGDPEANEGNDRGAMAPDPDGVGEEDGVIRGEEPPTGPLGRTGWLYGSRFDRLGPVSPGEEALAVSPPGIKALSPSLCEAAPLETGPLDPTLPPGYWADRVRQLRARVAAVSPATEAAELAVAPGPWIPVGPSIVRQAAATPHPATSGRVAGIAVAPGGTRVYVATANGGVWRSDDGGLRWRSALEDFAPSITPGGPADSLACGAIAIDPAAPDRVYVGTGEGETYWAHACMTGVRDSYFGVGPLRSDDGGATWVTEATAPGSPGLEEAAFFQLAVDPGDRERVVAATSKGLYRREPDGGGGHHWAKVRDGVHSSVIAARSGDATTFHAAAWGGPVLSSTDGAAWIPLGSGFPDDAARVSLAAQPRNPAVVFALAASRSSMELLGLYRFDAADGRWRGVSGVPPELLGRRGAGTGWYNLAIAADPEDISRVYLGGSSVSVMGQETGAVFRCSVVTIGASAGLSYTARAKHIGAQTHADIHALVLTPDRPDQLWVGCDGGVYVSDVARAGTRFEGRNVGLSTLLTNRLAHHPREPAVIFCGSQDNGTLRAVGDPAWLESVGGDGGAVVVHWGDPYRILRAYAYQHLERTEDGGQTPDSWTRVRHPARAVDTLFYAPLVTTPENPAAPEEAELIAFGSRRAWLSADFGTNWRSLPDNGATDDLPLPIAALAFASASVLYAGTVGGQVHRYSRSGDAWRRELVSDLGPAPLGFKGWVTDIAVDPSDASGSSIYVSFGGIGDFRHLWHFDGARWEARSGPGAGDAASLLDVPVNAVAVDPGPGRTEHIYIGTDVAVWHSADGGRHWTPFSDGIPMVPVVDLLLHRPSRLLRAATHGRGVYERQLGGAPPPPVELYLRTHILDTGRRPVEDGGSDPTNKVAKVFHWLSPDIKQDTPNAAGQYQTPSMDIDFYQFADRIIEGLSTGGGHGARVVSRVFVQVHNRSTRPASARVMLLATRAAAALPPLPPDYPAHLRDGTPIDTPDWKTVGIRDVGDVRAEAPRIASFELSPDLFPPAEAGAGRHRSLLALVHSHEDPFTSTTTDVDALAIGDRKVAEKSAHIVRAPSLSEIPTTEETMPMLISFLPSDLGEKLATGQLVVEIARWPGPTAIARPGGAESAGAPDEVRLGETYELHVRQRGANPGDLRGGATYRVQVTLGPDNAERTPMTIEIDEAPDETQWLRVTLPAEVLPASPDETPEVSVYFYSQLGLTPEPRPMSPEPQRGRFRLSLSGVPHVGPGEVRVTVVARSRAGELRQTKYLD